MVIFQFAINYDFYCLHKKSLIFNLNSELIIDYA